MEERTEVFFFIFLGRRKLELKDVSVTLNGNFNPLSI